jgi:choline kinase
MKYAIIAAGEGSRLASEGIDAPKPLVRIHGERLIDRLIRVFMDNEATEIVVICNDLTPLVEQHLRDIQANGLGALMGVVMQQAPELGSLMGQMGQAS